MTSRRLFLKSSAIGMFGVGSAPAWLSRALYAADAPSPRKKILVAIFQRGAVDGLNMVVPFGEKRYYSLRPNLAIPKPDRTENSAIDLDGFFGLHPALAPLKPIYDSGHMAIVHAVGSPDPTRSHFDAQDFMESGTPGVKSTEDGWINRHLQCASALDATPFRAVSLTPTLPRSLAGRAPAVAMNSIREFDLRPSAGARVASGFEGMYEGAVKDVLHGTGQETFDAIQFLKKSDPSRYAPSAGAEYPRGRYGDSLKQVAQLIKADVGVEVAFTEIGGWDHHAAEGGVQGQLAQRLRELGLSLAAFQKDLGDRMQDVVVVTLTEFGRTVHENGNRGTDHGHASVSLVMGGGVRGGKVQGRWPGLEERSLYEARDLAVTTDFRDLLGELLTCHLGDRDLAKVFPGYAGGPARFPGVMRG